MAFTQISSSHANARTRSMTLGMGWFDSLNKAFANEEYASPPEGIKATARHILVKSSEDADKVLSELASGQGFAALASSYSTCPSGSSGGSLGSFSPGTMVKEFDDVIFSADTNLGEVIGPVQVSCRQCTSVWSRRFLLFKFD